MRVLFLASLLFSSFSWSQNNFQHVQAFTQEGELYANQFASTIESEPKLIVYKRTQDIGLTAGTAFLSSYKYNTGTQQFDLVASYFNSSIQMDNKSTIAVSKRPSSSSHWLYLLSRPKVTVPTTPGKLSFAAINSNGTLTVQPGFIEVSNATPALQYVSHMLAGPPSNTGYLYTLANSSTTNDGYVGVISRNTLGIPTYSDDKNEIFGVPLQNPKHLAVSPDGFRVATVDDNRVAIFESALGTLSDYAIISAPSCAGGMESVLLTNNPNEIYVSGSGGIRRIKNVGGIWSCPETYFPSTWSSAEVKISPTGIDSLFLVTLYRSSPPALNRLSLVTFNGTAFSVLSSVDGPSFGSLEITNPTNAFFVTGAPSPYVVVGNDGTFVPPYGFNIFRFFETLFKNGFE